MTAKQEHPRNLAGAPLFTSSTLQLKDSKTQRLSHRAYAMRPLPQYSVLLHTSGSAALSAAFMKAYTSTKWPCQ